MSRPILETLRQVAPEAVTLDRAGRPLVTPRTTEHVAATLAAATRYGWKVRVEGSGSWMPNDAPADLTVSLAGLDKIVTVSPSDLVATVQAGVTIRQLQASLAPHRTYLALDPPGSLDRTLGSVLATGTSGFLRHRFGGPRDQTLGTTVVAGDGQVIRSGGVVVKNVAGYDLTKIQIGGFGAFGVITEVNIRLRALPQAERTLIARGGADSLLDAARVLAESNIDAAALELASPAMTGATDWCLLVHFVGTEAGVSAEVDRTRALARDAHWENVPEPAANALMQSISQAVVEEPVTLRFGVFPASVADLVDLLDETLGHRHLLAGIGAGGIRWSGSPPIDRFRDLRQRMAEREIPVTVERAPWAFRSAVGHFGALLEGVRPLTQRVREVFDPRGVFPVPLVATA